MGVLGDLAYEDRPITRREVVAHTVDGDEARTVDALRGAHAATDVDQRVGRPVQDQSGDAHLLKSRGATSRSDDGRQLAREAAGTETAVVRGTHSLRGPRRVV